MNLNMDANTQYWLNRVSVKLYKLFLAGIDFKIMEHPWLFDWDNELATGENLKNVAAEDNALTMLTQMGIIKSDHRENFYRKQQLESFADPLRGHIIWGGWDEFDPPKREYDYLRIIDDLYYDKFVTFCEEHSINYKEDKITATLEITNQRPTVRAGGKEFILKVLQDGSPLEIIEQATAHLGERITFDKLRQWTGRPNAFTNQNNFKQIFRKNEFGEGNVLHPFVEIRTDTFILKEHASLTPAELSAIQKVSTS
jgi:hypothetical protein